MNALNETEIFDKTINDTWLFNKNAQYLKKYGGTLRDMGFTYGTLKNVKTSVGLDYNWNKNAVPGGATGGPVFGSGTATSDSIPAFLSDGEYVVNAAATAKHYGTIDRINRGASPHDDRVPALLSALIAAVR